MIIINKYTKEITNFLFLLLIVFTVFDFKIVNFPMVILIFITLMNLIKIRKIEIDKVSALFGLFTFFIVANGFIQSNFTEKRYGLLILAFFAFFVSKIATRTLFLLRSFVFANFLVVIYGVFFLIKYYLEYQKIDFTVGGHINSILYLERPYLGFLCIITSLVCLYLLRLENKAFYKYLLISLMIIFVVYPFIISARMAILSYVFIGFIYFVFYFKKGVKFKSLIATSFLLLFGLMFSINDSLKERFEVLIRNEKNVELTKDKDPRMIIWPCAFEITKEPNFNVLFGMSSTKLLTDKLVDCYSSDTANLDRRNFFINSKFNTHNQYLDLYLTNGLIGLSLFILFLFQMFFRYRKEFVLLAMWFAFACFCLTENIFYRQTGFYLLILLVCFSEWIYGFLRSHKDFK